MKDNLIICKHCFSDACYVVENSTSIKTYSCFGCGFTTNSLMKEGEDFYNQQIVVLPDLYKDLDVEGGFDGKKKKNGVTFVLRPPCRRI